MTWTTSRNNAISDSLSPKRALQTLLLIKTRLKACLVPWTVVGSGSGSGGSFDMSGADLLPDFPSLTGAGDGSWICLQNVDGLQIVIQQINYSNAGYLYLYWSGDGGYELTSDASATLRPGNVSPPAKQVNMNDDGYTYIDFAGGSVHYKSIAVRDDGRGFILFGKIGAYACQHMAVVKVSGDPLDVDPYVGVHYAVSGNSNNAWDMSFLEGTSQPSSRRLWHPTGGRRYMSFCDLQSNAADVFDGNLQVNPYSNKTQLMAVVVGCPSVTYKFVKGIVEGYYRVPQGKGIGDKFENGELINMYNIAVPWGSSTDELL